ncbi:hypothetical protein F5144DRAFT_593312 [Chaetomium tenue]|uniref:Uncharacterized protein n=1 Tax=Chaetomium tenue TaxID=1854479 RepID=A0ACB7PEG1_9PEZI|nr:hypothetical protein F5144DRAFT_593312 [Chaetomium globosum]
MSKIKTEPIDGLGNHIYLEKQDRLREIGVDIPTSQDRKDALRGFHHELTDFDGKTLVDVINKANKTMGIRSGATQYDTTLPMFSDDILKIEISGPEKPHLTVIDVPGLFQVTDEGSCQCPVDRGPDTDSSQALPPRWTSPRSRTWLVKGNTLKLGYFIVRNRGADEDTLSIAECQMKEQEKFTEPLWTELTKLGHTGVQALRAELQGLLTELARRELPKQRAEQRECLVRLAARFERIVRDALDGRYDGNPIFSEKPELKLATKIMDLNEGFTDLVWKKGHTWEFKAESHNDDLDNLLEYETMSNAVLDSTTSIPELEQVICDHAACPAPLTDDIMGQIEKYYKESRGPELGTFGGALLSLTFRAQTSKWRAIVMTHVETVIVVAHRFIKTVLFETIGDQRIREELWGLVLLEKLQTAYIRAKNHAQFLLGIEVNGRPRTYNHHFSDDVLKSKAERLTQVFVEYSDHRGEDDYGIFNSTIGQMVEDKSIADQTKEDVHDILESYYKVSRKRVVDTICQQAIDHFLLDGSDSPLKVPNPELISKMSDTQLDMIAGEDINTKRERERLGSEIQGLEAAMKVTRG